MFKAQLLNAILLNLNLIVEERERGMLVERSTLEQFFILREGQS
jgi:hypothetical protein